MQFLGAIFRGEELLITCELVYVFADPATQTSRPVPALLREMLTGFEAGEAMLRVKTGSWAELGADARRIRTEVFCRNSASRPNWNGTRRTRPRSTPSATTGWGVRWPPAACFRAAAAAPRSGAWRCTVLRGCGFGRTGLARTGGAGAGRGDRAMGRCAQRTASDFYARLGFVPQGEPFEEAGIPHIAMTSALPLRR